MKQSLLKILCCPLCKNKLDLRSEANNDGQIVEEDLICKKCSKTYCVENTIPLLYISDNEVIARSKPTAFDGFVITSNRLSTLAECNVPKNRLGTLPYRKISLFLLISGWLLLLVACLFLIHTVIPEDITSGSKEVSILFFIMPISLLLFFADFIIYKIAAKDQYENQLQRLVQLDSASRLSEYDSRLKIKDKKECYKDISTLGIETKAREIAFTLKKYNFKGEKGLHIGCGGELHQAVSKPFFEKGYNMLGIDISKEYLREYNKIFKTDVILANAMALPLKNDEFDLINYTDIIEHLHHPFAGLCEAQRVLKQGGRIILATDYRNRFSPQCINPLIFFEAIFSLYYDKILGPRNMLSKFQDMEYYHLEFSKAEIMNMLESAGFIVIGFETYFAKSKMLTKIFRILPILRLMGGSIMVIGEKV